MYLSGMEGLDWAIAVFFERADILARLEEDHIKSSVCMCLWKTFFFFGTGSGFSFKIMDWMPPGRFSVIGQSGGWVHLIFNVARCRYIWQNSVSIIFSLFS